MTLIQSVLAFLLVYLCGYLLVNRLCQCIENCATIKAIAKTKELADSILDSCTEGKKINELSENHADQYR